MSYIANKLKSLMEQHKVTAREIAQQTGVGTTQISRILKDAVKSPTIDTIKGLASFFKISIDELIGVLPNKDTEKLNLYTWEDLCQKLINNKDVKPIRKMIPVESNVRSGFCTIVNDISMQPLFTEGSVIVVDLDRKPRSKSFVIAKHNNKLFFKQLVIVDGTSYLRPLDNNFDTMKLDASSTIVGTVVETNYQLP